MPAILTKSAVSVLPWRTPYVCPRKAKPPSRRLPAPSVSLLEMQSIPLSDTEPLRTMCLPGR